MLRAARTGATMAGLRTSTILAQEQALDRLPGLADVAVAIGSRHLPLCTQSAASVVGMTAERLSRVIRTLRGALVFLGLVIDCVASHGLRRLGLIRGAQHASAARKPEA
jgi:hypothetical protein